MAHQDHRIQQQPPPRVEVRGPCDLRCAWCNFRGTAPLVSSDELARVGAALEGLAAEGHRSVIFGVHHSEPTTHPDLIGMVASAKSAGFREILLSTSGVAIAERSYLAELRRAGLTDVTLTIAGAEGPLTDLLLGRQGSAAAKMAALEACLAEGVRPRVILALIRPTLHDLEALLPRLLGLLEGRGDALLHGLLFDPVPGMAHRRAEALWPRAGEILWTMARLRKIEPHLRLHARALPSCLCQVLGQVSLAEVDGASEGGRRCGGCSDADCPGPEGGSLFWEPRGGNLLARLRPEEPPRPELSALQALLEDQEMPRFEGRRVDLLEGPAGARLLQRLAESRRRLLGYAVTDVRVRGSETWAVLRKREGGRLEVIIEDRDRAGRCFVSGRRFALSYSSDAEVAGEAEHRVLRALHALLERGASS